MAQKQLGSAPAVAADAANKGYVDGALAAFSNLAGPVFRAFRNTTDQSLTASTFTKVQLNGESYDVSAVFDSVTNFRFQPTIAGYYHFDFGVVVQSSTSTGKAAFALIYKNGIVVSRGSQAVVPAGSEFQYFGSAGGENIYLNGTTDYVELFVYAELVTGTLSINFGSHQTFLTGYLVKADTWLDLASSAAVVIDIFTTPGANTWTKPVGAVWVDADLQAGGTGGGAGRKGAAGSARSGGAGGGSGGVSKHGWPASLLGATETVTVAGPAPGGASQTVNSTNGANGASGGSTTFGTYLKANGGAPGQGGGTGATSGGGAGQGLISNGGAGASTPATPGVGETGNVADYASSGGGSGGGIPVGNTAAAGGAGGGTANFLNTSMTAGSAGAVNTAGGNGTSFAATGIGTGGGGGGSSTTGNAGNGGDGGNYGAGGGGGGAATDGVGNSGAGGTGTQGQAIIRTYRGNVGMTATQVIAVSVGDEATAITVGTDKIKFRIPFVNGFKLNGIGASLTTAQASGTIFTVNVKEAGVSILSTKITIDNTETMSLSGAATPPVLSDTTLAPFAEMSVDVDQIGNGTAKGLKLYLLGFPL